MSEKSVSSTKQTQASEACPSSANVSGCDSNETSKKEEIQQPESDSETEGLITFNIFVLMCNRILARNGYNSPTHIFISD